MTPLAQAVLVICAVVLTVALVVTLASFRRATSRAEIVLQLLERVSGVVRRVEDISLKIARVVGVANSLASFRGITGVGSGLRTALSVFVSRLRA